MKGTATGRSVEEAVAALSSGRAVILPTDTVYGLCAAPHGAEAVRALYRIKGRREGQPTALVASDVEALLECLPELHGGTADVARLLLPGPYTLVVHNPSRRFPWLTGSRPETIGVRVPALSGPGGTVLRGVGVVAATSANRPGERDPTEIGEIPEEIRSACAAVLDGGRLPGVPSTILDLTGSEPIVLREGAVPAAKALARLRAAL